MPEVSHNGTGTKQSKVAVIYDSSYLMSGEDSSGNFRFHGLLHTTCEPLRSCTVTSILAEEVEAELAEHLAGADERKERLARFARKLLHCRRH